MRASWVCLISLHSSAWLPVLNGWGGGGPGFCSSYCIFKDTPENYTYYKNNSGQDELHKVSVFLWTGRRTTLNKGKMQGYRHYTLTERSKFSFSDWTQHSAAASTECL